MSTLKSVRCIKTCQFFLFFLWFSVSSLFVIAKATCGRNSTFGDRMLIIFLDFNNDFVFILSIYFCYPYNLFRHRSFLFQRSVNGIISTCRLYCIGDYAEVMVIDPRDLTVLFVLVARVDPEWISAITFIGCTKNEGK